MKMLFLTNSRMCSGVTREQVIAHLEKGAEKDDWDLVRKGIITHWLFKVGDTPGIMVVLDCDSIDEARDIISNAPTVKAGLLEFDIEPVNQFPRFD
jgi:hypothetical protein